SASCTWQALTSTPEYTATDSMPNSRQARIMRTAISPRLATRHLRSIVFLQAGGQMCYRHPHTPRRAIKRQHKQDVKGHPEDNQRSHVGWRTKQYIADEEAEDGQQFGDDKIHHHAAQ